MEIWYLWIIGTDYYQEVAVEHVTEDGYLHFSNGKRVVKTTDYHRYEHTLCELHAYRQQFYASRLAQAKRELLRARELLKYVHRTPLFDLHSDNE